MISQGFHRGFTAAEKTELWDRWQRGDLLKAIGRAFSKPSSSIYFQLARRWDLSGHGVARTGLTLSSARRSPEGLRRLSRPIDGSVAGFIAVDGKPRTQRMAAMIDTSSAGG